LLTRIDTSWPGTARPPRGGLVPSSVPLSSSLSTRTVRAVNPASASARSHARTPEQPGTGRVLPSCTVGSAGGNSPLPRACRTGAIASRQMVAPLPPPKPPTSSLRLGLSTMTLAAISGVYPTKATE
jgi:hypothetical protein